jgi:hypothetical protein
MPQSHKSLFAAFSSEKAGLIPTVINNDRRYKFVFWYMLFSMARVICGVKQQGERAGKDGR